MAAGFVIERAVRVPVALLLLLVCILHLREDFKIREALALRNGTRLRRGLRPRGPSSTDALMLQLHLINTFTTLCEIWSSLDIDQVFDLGPKLFSEFVLHLTAGMHFVYAAVIIGNWLTGLCNFSYQNALIGSQVAFTVVYGAVGFVPNPFRGFMLDLLLSLNLVCSSLLLDVVVVGTLIRLRDTTLLPHMRRALCRWSILCVMSNFICFGLAVPTTVFANWTLERRPWSAPSDYIVANRLLRNVSLLMLCLCVWWAHTPLLPECKKTRLNQPRSGKLTRSKQSVPVQPRGVLCGVPANSPRLHQRVPIEENLHRPPTFRPGRLTIHLSTDSEPGLPGQPRTPSGRTSTSPSPTTRKTPDQHSSELSERRREALLNRSSSTVVASPSLRVNDVAHSGLGWADLRLPPPVSTR